MEWYNFMKRGQKKFKTTKRYRDRQRKGRGIYVWNISGREHETLYDNGENWVAKG